MKGGSRNLLVAILALGFLLRLAGVQQLSLTHYDEGVYVQNGIAAAFGDPLEFNFDLPLHAPPLYPWMIGVACWLLAAPWPTAGVYVAAVFGVASIFVGYAVAARAVGRESALLAAILFACSDLHVAYSRMALTDVPVTFWFLVATYALLRLGESIEARSKQAIGWTLAVAACTAIAWNTKYNGWMPVAVGIAAALYLIVSKRALDRVPLQIGIYVLAAGGLAAAGYAPWYFHVDQQFDGGYAKVTAHHATYLGGLAEWPTNAQQHAMELAAYRHFGWVIGSALGLVATVAILVQAARRKRFNGALLPAGVAVLCGAACLAVGVDLVIIALALAGSVQQLLARRFPGVLLATWVLAFVVLVPLYHPYMRLVVPLLPFASCLAAPLLLSLVRVDCEKNTGSISAWIGTAGLACLLMGLLWSPFPLIPGRQLWERWSAVHSYSGVVDAIANTTEPDALVICQGQPPLTLYVPRERVPIGNVPFTTILESIPAGRRCYLAVDFFWLHAQPDPDALNGLLANRERLEVAAIVNNDLSLPTLGDFLTPEQLADKLATPPPALGSDGLPIPPALDSNQRDFIAIYAIRR